MKTELILITMENGDEIKAELYPEAAPKTVENFLKLVDEKFYDGLIFHRVIKGFMIQGGDPTGTGMGGSKDTIVGEFRANGFQNDLAHTRGVLSMARTNMPNSASSQFFIMHQDAPHPRYPIPDRSRMRRSGRNPLPLPLSSQRDCSHGYEKNASRW